MHDRRKVALVTGARTGVGLELTRLLLRNGWEVVVIVRSPLPAERLFEDATLQNRLRTYRSDLSDSSSLRSAIDAILAQEQWFDVLFNNAGVSPEMFELSPQNRELCFEVNAVAPYMLARELLPLLMNGAHKKIINTSSNALLTVKSFNPALLGMREEYRKLFGAYARSKLALSLWTMAVADELSGRGITIVSVCPGPMKTPMTAGAGMPWLLRIAAKFLFKNPDIGAGKLYAAAMDDGRIPAGSFIVNGNARAIPFPEAANQVRKHVDEIYRKQFR